MIHNVIFTYVTYTDTNVLRWVFVSISRRTASTTSIMLEASQRKCPLRRTVMRGDAAFVPWHTLTLTQSGSNYDRVPNSKCQHIKLIRQKWPRCHLPKLAKGSVQKCSRKWEHVFNGRHLAFELYTQAEWTHAFTYLAAGLLLWLPLLWALWLSALWCWCGAQIPLFPFGQQKLPDRRSRGPGDRCRRSSCPVSDGHP